MIAHAPIGSYPHADVSPELWERLEKLARSAGRGASELAEAVLREFLDENEDHLAAIDAGIASADAGELIDLEEVEADVQKRLAALLIKR